MTASILTIKGQTTVPKSIREHLKLKAGDKVDFLIESDGRVVLKPANIDIRQIGGMLSGRYQGKPLSPEDMDAAIATHLAATRMRKKRAA